MPMSYSVLSVEGAPWAQVLGSADIGPSSERINNDDKSTAIDGNKRAHVLRRDGKMVRSVPSIVSLEIATAKERVRRNEQCLRSQHQRGVQSTNLHNVSLLLPNINTPSIEKLSSPSFKIESEKMNIMEQIERELDTRLPYRIGCPKLPVLPAKSEPFALQHIFPDPEKTLSVILGILRQHGIEIGSGFVGSDHLFNDGHDKLPTITIAVDYDPATGSDHWDRGWKIQSRVHAV